MFGKMKKFSRHVLAGANVATIIIMLVVGYSGHVNPASHPLVSTISLAFPFLLLANVLFLVLWCIVKVRYVIIPMVGLLLCYQPVRTYLPINLPQHPEGETIKVISYNVWMYAMFQGYVTSMRIPEYLAAEDADLVCLQEADTPPAIQVGIDSIMTPIYAYKDTLKALKTGDVLVLYSKFPILSKERITYDSRGKAAAAFRVNISGDTVTVINNHFETTGLSSEDRENFKNMVDGTMQSDEARAESRLLFSKLSKAASKRAPQADALSDYLKAHSQECIILCGDFNDSPLSYAHHQVAKWLTDCFVASGNGFGFSYNRGGMYVRIDNIMCSKDMTPYACEVDSRIDVSDHYPIKCRLKIK